MGCKDMVKMCVLAIVLPISLPLSGIGVLKGTDIDRQVPVSEFSVQSHVTGPGWSDNP